VEEKEIQDELASIRNLMERSSKFISLSGISGILAGIYALIGAAFAYNMLYNGIGGYTFDVHYPIIKDLEIVSLLGVAVIVLLASVSTCIILSVIKAKKKGQPIWGKTSRTLLFNTVVPLATGGLFIFILLTRGYFGIVAPTSLIFYGLALVNASNFTYSDVRYLGVLEILLGLTAACLPGYGLLFWAIGFGVLHIVYGSVMYFKYDR